eukprot:1531736-Lingulodinium_polyedra.AAC.1
MAIAASPGSTQRASFAARTSWNVGCGDMFSTVRRTVAKFVLAGSRQLQCPLASRTSSKPGWMTPGGCDSFAAGGAEALW